MINKLTVVVGMLMIAANAWGVPEVGFVAPGPGLHVPFDNVTRSNTLTYGKRTFETGAWLYDADTASTSTGNAYLWYLTTLAGSETAIPMPTDKDWVFEIKYKYVGDYNGEVPWIAYAAGDERIICLWQDSDTLWSIRTGDAGGGWTTQVSGLALGTSYHTFTTHYKADVQRLDIYMDGALLKSNVALGHGVYSLKQVQLQTQDEATQEALLVHALEDSLGSNNGSSIINVVTYYQEHAAAYPAIDLDDPAGSDWTSLIQNVIDNMTISRGRMVFFPGGRYRCTGTINVIKSGSTPLTFMGVGRGLDSATMEGSVIEYTGGTNLFMIHAPAYCVNFKDLQLQGPGRSNDETAIRDNTSDSYYVARCYFENLTINNFARGIYLLGYADGMVFRDLRFSNVNRCINIEHSDASVIEGIEADPFYDYVLYLYQPAGILINNIRAKSTTASVAKVFILAGSGYPGKSIEINGVRAEDVNNLATVTCMNVSLKNFYYHAAPGSTVSDDAFVFAQVSDQQPINCLIENATFDLDGVARGTKKDIALRTVGETVNLIESLPTAGYSKCEGLRIINSELDTSDIPTTLYYGGYIGIEKYSKGTQWVGNQRKWSYGTTCPTYSANRGDIVWNTQPTVNGYIGWICVGGSTWKGFGQVEN